MQFSLDVFSASPQKGVESTSTQTIPFALLGFCCDFSLSAHSPRLLVRGVVPQFDSWNGKSGQPRLPSG